MRASSALASSASRRLGCLILAVLRQQRFQIAVFGDELCCRLDADAGHARHVVCRIAGQRLDVDHLFRRDAEFLQHLGRIDRPVLDRIQHLHAIAHQLHQILVRRNDDDLRAHLARLIGIGGDQIVGLVAGQFDAGHVEGAHRLADQRELRDQLFRRLGPVRLVLVVDLVAEGLAAGIEDDGQMIGAGIVHQPHQHRGEAEHRIGRRAVRARHRRQGVEGAEDIARAVDQIEIAHVAEFGLGFAAGLASDFAGDFVALAFMPAVYTGRSRARHKAAEDSLDCSARGRERRLSAHSDGRNRDNRRRRPCPG